MVANNSFEISPIRLFEQHTGIVQECVNLMVDIVRAASDPKERGLNAIANRVFELESDADGIRQRIQSQLCNSLSLPVSLPAFFRLLECQDLILDRSEEIAAGFTYRTMWLPKEVRSVVVDFVTKVVENCTLSCTLVSQYTERVDSGSLDGETLTISKGVAEVNEGQDTIKGLKISLIRQIFAREFYLPSADIIHWKTLIDHIAGLSSNALSAANQVQLLIENSVPSSKRF